MKGCRIKIYRAEEAAAVFTLAEEGNKHFTTSGAHEVLPLGWDDSSHLYNLVPQWNRILGNVFSHSQCTLLPTLFFLLGYNCPHF